MIANFINRAFGRISLRGVARVRHVALKAKSPQGLEAVRCWPLELGRYVYVGGRERVGLDWRPGSGRVLTSPAQAPGWCVPDWQLT